MKISSRTSFTPRILTDLARNQGKGPVRIGEMSRRLGISVKYLEQIIKSLRKADFITGVRGAKGGYVLTRMPDHITLGQLVRLTGDGLHLAERPKIPDPHSRMDEDQIRHTWAEAIQALYSRLDAMTLNDIMKPTKDRTMTARRTVKKSIRKRRSISFDADSPDASAGV